MHIRLPFFHRFTFLNLNTRLIISLGFVEYTNDISNLMLFHFFHTLFRKLVKMTKNLESSLYFHGIGLVYHSVLLFLMLSLSAGRLHPRYICYLPIAILVLK